MLRISVFIVALWFFLFHLSFGVLPAKSKCNIAVFNFQPINMDAIGYNMEILYSIVSELEEEKFIVVLPRRKMEEILSNEGLTQESNVHNALRAGIALNVNYILFGEVEKLKAKINCKLNLLNVSASKLINTWNLEFSSSQEISSKGAEIGRRVVELIKKCSNSVSPDIKGDKDQNIVIESFNSEYEDNKVIIEWDYDSQDPISHFRIYRSKYKEGPFQFLGKTKSNIYKDHKIGEGDIFYYLLKFYTSSGNLLAHDKLTKINTFKNSNISPPIVLSAKGLKKSVQIEFVVPLDDKKQDIKIDHYNLYRKEEKTDQWTLVRRIELESKKSALESLKVKDKNLSSDAEYEYCMSSVTSNGEESKYSKTVKATTK